MKVQVSDLPVEGLKINDTIPLDSLNARMAEGRYKDIVFLVPPKVDISVTPTQAGGAETKGVVRSKYRQPCGRCLESLERDVEVECNFTLIQRPEPEVGVTEEILDEAFIDDVGLVYFDGDQIDLEDLIQETLILSLSLFWSPPVKENGDCELCAFNISKNANSKKGNDKIKLGDLFKQVKGLQH